jgi:eukaryotic-like serine/threonine-protein kinase
VAEAFAPGRVLGDRYRLDHKLARGGMATVWVAEDPLLSRKVAIKVLHPELAVDDGLRARFRNEAIAAARLTHPGIVATYDTGDDDGTAYIVMELIDGPTVRQLLRDEGPLPVREVVRIGMQVADALEAAHRAGIVHRDVKPPNVLVPPAGPVKVTDFGIAKAVGVDDLTRTGTVMGTARYLAPGQVNGRPIDARTDVYGLGLLLYEMLCGRPPFGGDTDVATAMARLTTTAPPIRPQRPDVPQELDDIVHKCMARDPARRYASAGAVRAALAALRTNPQGTTPRPAPPPTPRPTPRPPKARRPAPRRNSGATWVWVVLVFLLAIGAAVAAFLVLRDDQSNTRNPDASTPSTPQSLGITDGTDPEAQFA